MTVKITRDTFLYMAPTQGKENFAQCESCRMFVLREYLKKFDPDGKVCQGTKDRCIAHGSSVELDADDSCGVYLKWATPDAKPNLEVMETHAKELCRPGGLAGSVTPEESGLVHRRVQCHRCQSERDGATRCDLYHDLEEKMPEMFDLGGDGIEPHACCNAQEPKKQTGRMTALMKAAKS